MKRLYSRWCVINKEAEPTTCVLALPGRDQSGFWMAQNYNDDCLRNTLIIGITPEHFEWYPMPNGPNDQQEAISGIEYALESIEDVLAKIQKYFGITPERIALAGFSAGAVMAVQAAIHLPHKFPVVLAHAGAILEPESVPYCNKPDTKFFLFHSMDDKTFNWNERYLPMKTALIENNYYVRTIERSDGSHCLLKRDTDIATDIVNRTLSNL